MFIENLSEAALVTHKGCQDGSVCAVLFQMTGGKKENIFFSGPNHNETDEIFNDLLDNWKGSIIMADLSVSVETANTVCNDDGIVLFDHHKSAIPLKEFNWCEIEVNNNRSGCKMFYDWLLKMSHDTLYHLKHLVDVTDDIDRWVKNIPVSESIAVLHNVLGQELFIKRFMKASFPVLSHSEEYMIEIEHHKRENYIKQAKKNVTIIATNIDGHDVNIGFVFANKHQSMLGHAIYADPMMGVDVVVMVGNKTISMRARPNCPVDLSKVAELNNGGGHFAASGCDLSSVLGQDLLEMVIERLKFS